MASQTKNEQTWYYKNFCNYSLLCNLEKSGQQMIIPGQRNVPHSLFTKSIDELLTASYTCTFLLLRIHMWTPWKLQVCFNFSKQNIL